MGRPGKQKWLKVLLAMQVGDSFTVDTDAERVRVMASALCTRKVERKLVTTDKVFLNSRREGDKFRIWRVAPPESGIKDV